MENLESLSKQLNLVSKKIVDDLIKAQRDTAESICNDAKSLAPSDTGKYANTIHVTDTVVSGSRITTKIVTNKTVVAKSNGNEYNLGYLLENGTLEHAIPNAFNWGVIYGFDSDMYKRTLQKDWHPGFAEMPHFIPALNQNKSLYDENISRALDKEFK